MNYILFDGTVRNALLPFTFTRPVADIRVGILTIREKWEKHLGETSRIDQKVVRISENLRNPTNLRSGRKNHTTHFHLPIL